MFEKVNPSHPDKVADRIAGALVDMAYAEQDRPRISVEVLAGHGECLVIAETSVGLDPREVEAAALRISGEELRVRYVESPQDDILASNQRDAVRCGDNGVFRGMPVTDEQRILSSIARSIYSCHPSDGKYVIDGGRLVICQSLVGASAARELSAAYGMEAVVNPLGPWKGGLSVDCGATNRKLGSDMGDAVTGGGLHGKDLSKADASVNIYAHLMAQQTGEPVSLSCAIGDEQVGGVPFAEMVEAAGDYVRRLGGFERFAEWGLL